MKGKIIITKTLSAVLTATLTLTNFLVIATHMSEVHATEGELENQNVKIQGSDVEFDAYFKDKEQTITHSLKQDIDEETNLYLSIDVKKGYVKGARIEIKGEDGEEANFKIKEQVDTEDIKGIDSQNNTIELNQMNNQIKKEIAIPVINSREEKYKIENLNKTNDIKIIVEYVTNGGKTKEVENTIKVNMEWTKEANVEVKQEVKMFIPYEVENEKGTILQTEVEAGIENNSLPERQLDVYVKVPEVEGKLPKEIMVRKDEAGEETQEETTYDEEQGIIKISKSNEIDEEGKVTWKDTQNKYILTYKYEDKVKEIDVGQKAVGIASIYGTNEIKNEINEIQILEEAKNTKTEKEAIKLAKKAYEKCPECFDAVLF